MKVTKTVMIGALSLAAFGSIVNAATVVRLCGSTAFRAVVHQALQTAVFDSAPTFGYAGTSGVSGANCSEFSGNIGGSPFLIKTYWSGSEAGIQAVDQDSTGLALYFVDPTNNGQPTVGGVATALTVSPGTQNLDDSTSSANQTAHPSYFELHIPDGDFSDTFQAASQFNTSGNQSYNGHKYPALTAASGGNVASGGVIGVIPFQFVASHTSTITNITSQLFRALASEGSLLRGQFFGNTTDSTIVTLLGRDADSGTRVTVLSETGYGALNAVNQSYPYNNSQTTTPIAAYGQTVTSVSQVPASTVDGVPLVAGNGGYSSGGNLSKAMTSVTTGFGDFVSYLGASDAANALNSANSSTPAITLSYNGVAPSPAGIEDGDYTFWGYEHVYYRAGSSVASTINTVAQDIANQPTGSIPTGGVLPINIALGDMTVARGADGGTVE